MRAPSPRHRLIAFAVAAASISAACTSSADVSNQSSASTAPAGPTTPESAPVVSAPTTDETQKTDVPTTTNAEMATIVAPDPAGLPELSTDPAILSGTLDNGLQYIVRDNDRPGARAEMRLVVDAGSARQNEQQGGGAHFLEHMLFNGTEQFPENELIAVLRSFGAGFGADINAYTNYDETVYELTMPTADPSVVSTGLDVLQQWLSAASLDPAQVEAERGIVLDEWRSAEQTAGGRASDAVQKFFLDGSPYENRKPIGASEEITATTDGPLRDFYDNWYRPDNAAVIVVGDIDPADIERQILERFQPAVARGETPVRDELIVDPATEARAAVFDDPDLSEGFGFVTLPMAVDPSLPPEASVQRDILDDLAFDIIATRLSNDALRGDAPFDDARVDSSAFVRLLDAPEIGFSADGDDMEASTQAVIDEYERVRRFGFTQAEVDRAVATKRSAAQVDYDGRNSRQDASFADEYVRHVLEGESIPTAERSFEYVTAVLDGATPENVAYMFVTRYESTGAHIFVGVPSNEADAVPDADVFVEQAVTAGKRSIESRIADDVIGDELMAVPEPTEVADRTQLADGLAISFVAPELLTFANGVRVALDTTPITDGVIQVEARSPGGTTVLADTDVATAEIAADVVEASGVGEFDPVALDAFLSDKEVDLDATIDVFTEGFSGTSSTNDIETMFQLMHLLMTRPRVDPITLDQYVDDQLPLAQDPSIDPNYARFKTLTDARYDDPRYLLVGPDDLQSVQTADIKRVFADRFGDASDWVFSFTGDVDVDQLADLSARYLGTLPATGRVEAVDYVEPAPPPGAIVETANAGEGDQASVTFLFTGQATSARRDDIAARMVQEVVTARLTDVIREELGESYSPFSSIELTSGAQPLAESFLSISTGPDLVDDVSSAVLEQVADISAGGVSDAEFGAARQTLSNELELFSNEQINDEILDVLTDPAGNGSFADFENEAGLLGSINRDDLTDYARRWLPADQYIEVRILPR